MSNEIRYHNDETPQRIKDFSIKLFKQAMGLIERNEDGDITEAQRLLSEACALGHSSARIKLIKLESANNLTPLPLPPIEPLLARVSVNPNSPIDTIESTSEPHKNHTPEVGHELIAQAERGSHVAMYELYKNYKWGSEVFPPNKHLALSWLMRAATAGNHNAEYRMGEMLYHGWEVKKHIPEAQALISKAALAGLLKDQNLLTYIDIDSDSNLKPKHLMIDVFRNNPSAIRRLSKMYLEGDGVIQSKWKHDSLERALERIKESGFQYKQPTHRDNYVKHNSEILRPEDDA